MTTVGIIGGVGPESTIDYYRLLVGTYQARRPDGSYPSIIINSIDLQKVVALVTANRLEELAAHLAAEVGRLENAGASFGALSANTPHVVFDEVERASPIPLISIVKTACDAAKSRGLRRLALVGTRFTMSGTFYPAVFSAEGIQLVAPSPEEQTLIHDRYMNELINGVFKERTREELLSIIGRLKEQERIDGVILAGTELPLLLRSSGVGVEVLDTTELHVNAIVARMLG